MANSQWTLKVLFYDFENKYNAEIHQNGLFCCCDTSTCVEELADLHTNCSDRCDTSFNLSIAPCNASRGELCSAHSTGAGVTLNGPSFMNYSYFFDLESDQRPENVRCSKENFMVQMNVEHKNVTCR